MDNVNNWHIFKSVCERTQNKLELLIKRDGSQLEEVCSELSSLELSYKIC